jgi:hypothetical protein
MVEVYEIKIFNYQLRSFAFHLKILLDKDSYLNKKDVMFYLTLVA